MKTIFKNFLQRGKYWNRMLLLQSCKFICFRVKKVKTKYKIIPVKKKKIMYNFFISKTETLGSICRKKKQKNLRNNGHTNICIHMPSYMIVFCCGLPLPVDCCLALLIFLCVVFALYILQLLLLLPRTTGSHLQPVIYEV